MGEDASMIFNGDRDELGRYVRDLADEMGLRDWAFVTEVEESFDPGDQNANIGCTYGRKFGTVKFRGDWSEWEPEYLRMVATHELVHAHLDPIRLPLANIRAQIGQTLFDVTHGAQTDFIEYATDAIAVAWASKLPLPIKAKTGKKKGKT